MQAEKLKENYRQVWANSQGSTSWIFIEIGHCFKLPVDVSDEITLVGFPNFVAD